MLRRQRDPVALAPDHVCMACQNLFGTWVTSFLIRSMTRARSNDYKMHNEISATSIDAYATAHCT